MASSSCGSILYRDSLKTDDRKRYEEKMALCHGLDPYELIESDMTVSNL